MLHTFFLFLLFSLFSLNAGSKDPYSLAVTEGEPATLVEGCVSSITGDLYLAETDALICGYVPLRLPRHYLSGDGRGTLANWSFINHLTAIYRGGETEHSVTIQEPNGSTFVFRCGVDEVYDHFYKKKHTPRFFPPSGKELPGLTNTTQGSISGHSNLKNALVRLEHEGKYLTAYCSDKTTRRYKVHKMRKHFKDVFKGEESRKIKYLLESETLPSGHKVLYDYDGEDRLVYIRTMSPDTQTTYASAWFHYHNKHADKAPHVDISLSDGRTLRYIYEEKDKDLFLLKNVTLPDVPEKILSYHGRDKHRGNLVSRISQPQMRFMHIEYYDEGRNDVGGVKIKVKDKHSPLFLRVKTLQAPVGNDATAHTTHRFFYNMDNQTTDVREIDNTLTRYHYNSSMRLHAIERLDAKDVLNHKETFEWSEQGDLRSRGFYDGKGSLLFIRRLHYDDRGNVLQDELSGNLSGQKGASEVYRIKRQYSQDGRDLLLKEEEQNGKTTLYTYRPDTNLICAKFLCDNNQIKIRTFYEYNDKHVLVREIQDDGRAQDKNDLSEVHTRTIKVITQVSSGPFVDMPQIIEEKYWDGSQEQLLSKKEVFYTTGGHIARQDIYDALGALRYSIHNTYDALGHLLTETNALGQVATYTYDVNGNRKTALTASARRTAQMAYDHSNRLTELEEIGCDGIVHKTHYTYDRKHNKTSMTDYLGNTTHYVYDNFGHLIETHLPAAYDDKGDKISPVLFMTYDCAGRESSCVDAKGNSTSKSYNVRSQVTCIRHPDGAEERFVYNLDGTLKMHTDAEGGVTTHTYDVFGRRTSTKDPLGNTTTYTYDAFHLLAIRDAEGHVISYTYDGAGRKIAEQSKDERIEYSYDSLNRMHCVKTQDLMQFTAYDLLHRVIEERQEDTMGHLFSKVLYSYDEAGNKKSITRTIMQTQREEELTYDSFDRLILHVDALGYKTHTSYDEQHSNTLMQRTLRKSVTDALGQKSIEIHDALNRKISHEIQNAQGESCSYEEKMYDRNHNLVRQVSTLFPQKSKVEITWEYDKKNRCIALFEPQGKTTRYAYTPCGRLKETLKPDHVVLKRSYDANGSLIHLSSSEGSIDYAFTYNANNQFLTATDLCTQQMTVRTLDHRGRILTEKLATDLTFANTYDRQGRRIELTLPQDNGITYTYDALHLREVARRDSSGTVLYTHHYLEYDLSHHLLSSALIGNLGALTYTISPLGTRSEIASTSFTQTVDSYDAVGNITALRTQSAQSTYAYDDLYQLKEESGLFSHTYTHDSHFNRLQKDEEHYTLSALNQRTDATYDANGNLRSGGDILSAEYDPLDRLLSVETSTHRLTFTYDSFNRRLSKTVYDKSSNNTGQHFFLYDGQNEIGTTDAAGAIIELRVLGLTPHAEIGAAIAIELQGNIYAPVHDLFGNVVQLLALEGTCAQSYQYDSFGNHSATSALSNSWRYSSKRLDETGLIYFGRRYYDTRSGTWMTPDPLGFDGGINFYAYVQNNPLIHLDLYGLSAVLPMTSPLLSTHMVAENSQGDPLTNATIATTEGLGHAGIDLMAGVAKTGQVLSLPLYLLSGQWDAWESHWNGISNLQSYLHGCYSQQMEALFPPHMRSVHYSFMASTAQSAFDGMTLAASLGSSAAMASKVSKFVPPPLAQLAPGLKTITPSIKSYLPQKWYPSSTTLPNSISIQPSSINVQPIDIHISKNPVSHLSNPLQGIRYKEKVINQRVPNLSAGRSDFHGFPDIVDNYAHLGTRKLILGRDGITRTKVVLEGGFRKRDGVFEWIIEPDKFVNHRMFIPNKEK